MASTSSTEANPQLQVKTNPRGIPHAPFISNVQEYLGGQDEDVEPALQKFQETMSKYKFMEVNTAQRRHGLEEKIPDIQKTLEMVEFLKEKKDEGELIKTTFELNDTLYAKAELEKIDQVHLWLGANVMLEYPIQEAIQLLESKLSGAENSLEIAKEDLNFLREQITVMEVNTARVHNWDVKRRRERREQLESQQPIQAKIRPSHPPSHPSLSSSSTAFETLPPPAPPLPSSSSHPPPPPQSTSLTSPKPSLSSTNTKSILLSTIPSSSSTSNLLAVPRFLVPPLHFNMVSKGIYRSGHPNERNFPFLHGLKLNSIMYLANEDYRSNVVEWAKSQSINVFHFPLSLNKDPITEMDQNDVLSALSILLNRNHLPILLHCNKGKYRVGCLVALLRRLQGWSHTSIFEEYSRFAGSKISDFEWIQVFDLSKVRVNLLCKPDWL